MAVPGHHTTTGSLDGSLAAIAVRGGVSVGQVAQVGHNLAEGDGGQNRQDGLEHLHDLDGRGGDGGEAADQVLDTLVLRQHVEEGLGLLAELAQFVDEGILAFFGRGIQGQPACLGRVQGLLGLAELLDERDDFANLSEATQLLRDGREAGVGGPQAGQTLRKPLDGLVGPYKLVLESAVTDGFSLLSGIPQVDAQFLECLHTLGPLDSREDGTHAGGDVIGGLPRGGADAREERQELFELASGHRERTAGLLHDRDEVRGLGGEIAGNRVDRAQLVLQVLDRLAELAKDGDGALANLLERVEVRGERRLGQSLKAPLDLIDGEAGLPERRGHIDQLAGGDTQGGRQLGDLTGNLANFAGRARADLAQLVQCQVELEGLADPIAEGSCQQHHGASRDDEGGESTGSQAGQPTELDEGVGGLCDRGSDLSSTSCHTREGTPGVLRTRA